MQTEVIYNESDKNLEIEDGENEGNIINLSDYNQYIKSIEPNLNKILFSKKVVLVEGPNDLITYDYIIKRKVKEKLLKDLDIKNKDDEIKAEKYSKTYLNFENIVIIPHHGKSTVNLMVKLCEHFKIDYFVITYFDFCEDFSEELSKIKNKRELKENNIYINFEDKKGMITTNWKIINQVGLEKLHFNVKKLESVLEYDKDDKDSIRIWKRLNEMKYFGDEIFPKKLRSFLGIDKININKLN